MFTLVGSDCKEEELDLNELLHRAPYTLLYFYPKDNTPGCTLEATDFTSLHQAFATEGIQIVGVSKDTLASHCSFITKHGLLPSYISDPDLVLHKQFGARGEKNNYGKLVTGVIRSTVLLESTGTIIKQRNNVRATGHAQKILKEIHHLLHNTP